MERSQAGFWDNGFRGECSRRGAPGQSGFGLPHLRLANLMQSLSHRDLHRGPFLGRKVGRVGFLIIANCFRLALARISEIAGCF
jgi:hypothetical protein